MRNQRNAHASPRGKEARAPRATAVGEEEGGTRAFPFTAVMNQDELKLALLLNVVDPRIGGCLALGDRGAGKSAAVKGLVELLPSIDVVQGDDFNSHPSDPSQMGPQALERFNSGGREPLDRAKKRAPFVEVPLGATEDRVCGTIDVEQALTMGRKAFQPGLLAKANRGVLFVDEVNLLDDSIVDLLLDSAASGVNSVEREGVSVTHPARFILVGAGSPSEGDLRPQLLDRFGMSARVYTVTDTAKRLELAKNLLQFDSDPSAFSQLYQEDQAQLATSISLAQERVDSITIPREARLGISRICSQLDLDGLRGDIVTTRATAALAALEGREEASIDDIRRVAPPCLRHRMRKDPLSGIDNGFFVERAFAQVFLGEDLPDPQPPGPSGQEPSNQESQQDYRPGAWSGLPTRRK